LVEQAMPALDKAMSQCENAGKGKGGFCTKKCKTLPLFKPDTPSRNPKPGTLTF